MTDSKSKLAISVVTLLLCLPLLFYGLDHYALWDDEALTALAARGVIETGYPTAFLDHNIVAYRNGALLHKGLDRSTPPLSAYILAPIMYLGATRHGYVAFHLPLWGF